MFVLIQSVLAACVTYSGAGADGRPVQVSVDGSVIVADSASCNTVALPKGAVLTPGLVEVNASVGLAEVGMEDATVHRSATGRPVRATFTPADAYDPESVHVGVLRRGGITGAYITPSGGMVAGAAGRVRLAGATQAKAVVRRRVALHVNLGGSSFADELDRLGQLFDDVQAWSKNRDAVERRAFRPLMAEPRELEALLPYVEGRLPIVMSADRAVRIEALLRFADDRDIRLVINGAAEGWRHREALAAAKVAVVVDPFVYGPGGFGQREGRPDNPTLLAEAGVDVLFASWTHNSPSLTQFAANAVRAGMDRRKALEAITIGPDRVFGEPGPLGFTIGAPADLVVWSGDPLRPDSWPLTVIVNGEERSLLSRQTELRDRYRDLPGSPLPAHELPKK